MWITVCRDDTYGVIIHVEDGRWYPLDGRKMVQVNLRTATLFLFGAKSLKDLKDNHNGEMKKAPQPFLKYLY